MKFRLIIANPAKSQLRRLDRDLQRRILARFDQLCVEPLNSPLSDWVEGVRDLRKTRVGAWRIIFHVNAAERLIEVRAIRPRGQAYRGL